VAQQPQERAPFKPYKKVAVTLPTAMSDPSFEAFRKQLADAVRRKDRTAVGALIVAQGFFWEREGGNGVDEKKSALENFAAATGLDAKDGSGWEFLGDYAAEPSASRVGDRNDMICSPATPLFEETDLLALVRDTETNAIEWGYPLKDGIEAREGVKPDSKLIEKLGMHFVRVVFDDALPDTPEPMLRIVTPSGKLAVIPADTLAPLGIDQVCYVKQGNGWKIMGFIGEGAPQ
jgi:hypothetical protein